MSAACSYVCNVRREQELFEPCLRLHDNERLRETCSRLTLVHPKISPLPRTLYIKLHGGSEELEGRALFVDDVPPGWFARDLEDLFGAFGDVAEAVLHPSGMSGMVAFADVDGPRQALDVAAAGGAVEYCPRWAREGTEEDGPIGLRKLVTESLAATQPDQRALEQEVNDWWEANERRKAEKEAQRRAVMEEEGWTMVVSHKGRKRTRDEGGTAVGAVRAERVEEAKKKKKPQALQDFYRFQQREKHRNELAELRKAFEEDKKKLQALRGARKPLL